MIESPKAEAGRGSSAHRVGSERFASIVRESPLSTFMLSLPKGDILAVSPGVAALLDRTEGDLVGRPIWDLMSEGPTGILDLLAAGSVDGVELRRTVLHPDGTTLSVRAWLTAFAQDDERDAAVGIVSERGSISQLSARPVAGLVRRPLVIGTVDAQWRIDRISSDVDRLLGHPAQAGLGQSILSVVHPEDLPALLTTLATAVEQSTGAMLPIRLVTPDGGWTACDVLVTPLPQAPQFAFVVSLADSGRASDRGVVEQQLWDLALGAEAAETSRRTARLPVEGSVRGLGRLTTRELQVVTRLLDGKRVPAIARELFLAQGTVRNHLSSVFHKLGVGSQQELLDLLRST